MPLTRRSMLAQVAVESWPDMLVKLRAGQDLPTITCNINRNRQVKGHLTDQRSHACTARGRHQGGPEMNWKRWSSWMKGDARWNVSVLDNRFLSVAQTTSALVGWANEHLIN